MCRTRARQPASVRFKVQGRSLVCWPSGWLSWPFELPHPLPKHPPPSTNAYLLARSPARTYGLTTTVGLKAARSIKEFIMLESIWLCALSLGELRSQRSTRLRLNTLHRPPPLWWGDAFRCQLSVSLQATRPHTVGHRRSTAVSEPQMLMGLWNSVQTETHSISGFR